MKMKNWLLRAGIISTLLAGFFLSGCKDSKPENLPFETLDQGDGFGIPGQEYKGDKPDLLIITSLEEIENPGLGVKFPASLTRSLLALDYQRFFAILILDGFSYGTVIATMDIQHVERVGNQVTIRYTFPESAVGTPSLPASSSPYHLIKIAKEGDWSEKIKFVLMRNDKTVAERTQFIP